MKDKMKDFNFGKWATFTLAGVAIIVFYFLVKNFDGVRDAVGTLTGALRPFIIGFIIAYLLCPVYNAIVRRSMSILRGRVKTEKGALRYSRIIGTLLSLGLLIGIIAVASGLLIPHIVRSVVQFFGLLPSRLESIATWISDVFSNASNLDLAGQFNDMIDSIGDYVITYAREKILPSMGNIMSRVSTGLINTVSTFLDALIGLIACVYFLNMKESFRAHIIMIIRSRLSEAQTKEICDFGAFTNKTFGGFINGKIIDSIIIGIICYVAMLILKLPDPELIATLVGVTNIIPFFGPFIGAIPSALIICVQSPFKALVFLIMILVLQQFDGNILGPMLLGDRVGLSSFWVMFVIIVAGGLFGPVGMILGVPVFSVISYYFLRNMKGRLAAKGLSNEEEDYINMDVFDLEKRKQAALESNSGLRKLIRKKNSGKDPGKAPQGEGIKEESADGQISGAAPAAVSGGEPAEVSGKGAVGALSETRDGESAAEPESGEGAHDNCAAESEPGSGSAREKQ